MTPLKLEIAVDFDGTCVKHAYPNVGADIGAAPVLKRLVESGHRLIIFTMRSGEQLEDAIRWFATNGIPLYGVQVNPTQTSWTKSVKCYAHLYLDDAALGAPLLFPDGERPHYDWVRAEEMLVNKGVLKSCPK